MGKGQQTREEILSVALNQASQFGLEGISIGALAKQVGMSKSGLFAHFGSKSGLQRDLLLAARTLFTNTVVRPAMAAPRGLPRVRALFNNWLDWMVDSPLTGGCLFAQTAWEFDDRPGPVRDEAAHAVADMLETLERSVRIAVEEGHLPASTRPEHMAYQMHSLILGFQVQVRLLGRANARELAEASFEALLS